MKVTLYTIPAMMLAVALLAAGCDGLGAGKPKAATSAVGPTLPEPPVNNPTVELEGRTYYLNARRDPALPEHLRIACSDIHLLDPPHWLLLMRGDDVLQAAPIDGRYGYLADVTGNGVDEVIVMREPMTRGLRARPFTARVWLTFAGESPPTLRDVSAERKGLDMVVYRQGERLQRIHAEHREADRRVRIGGRWDAGRTAQRTNEYTIATTSGTRRLWADLYGDARPVWCEIDSKLSTLTTRGGTKFHRFNLELVAWWRYDRSAGILEKVAAGRSVFSPTSEQMFLGKLRGCLAEQAPLDEGRAGE